MFTILACAAAGPTTPSAPSTGTGPTPTANGPRTPGDVTPFPDRVAELPDEAFIPYDLAVTDDGGVCVIGQGLPYYVFDLVEGAELRLGPDGLPDPAHGTDGWVRQSAWLSAVAAGPDDGCFVAAGALSYVYGPTDGRVELHDATGQLDPRFAPWSNDLSADYELITDLAGLAGGGVLVLRGDSAGMQVVRLLPDGTPDPAFGTAGITLLPVAIDCAASTYCDEGLVRALPDGRVLAVVGRPATAVVLDEVGVPDPTYGVGGVATASGSFWMEAADATAAGDVRVFGRWSDAGGLAPWVEGLDPAGGPALGPLSLTPSAPFDVLSGAVLSDGRLVFGGASDEQAALLHTDGVGAPDPGPDGVELVGTVADTPSHVDALTVAGNDVVVGVAYGRFPTLVFAR